MAFGSKYKIPLTAQGVFCIGTATLIACQAQQLPWQYTMRTVGVTGCASALFFYFLSKRLARIIALIRKHSRAVLAQETDEVSEIKRLVENSTKDLLRSTAEAKSHEDKRKELIANAAHDIKGPLASILGYLEESKKKLQLKDIAAAEGTLAICTKNAKLLERLVKEIFEAAKFDNLNGNLVKEVIHIDEILSDLVQKYLPRAFEEKKEIKLKLRSESALALVDIGLLERALSNILDNALKYTPSGGSIEVGSIRQDEQVLINISDTGPGIPEKDLPHLFDRLYRVERDRSKEAKGSGLGLSIVKKIVEAHRGTVYVSSTLGAGTTLQMSIPLIPKDQIASALSSIIGQRK